MGFDLHTEYWGLLYDAETSVYGYENISRSRATDSFNILGPHHDYGGVGCFGYVQDGGLNIRITGKPRGYYIPAGFWFSTPAAFHGTLGPASRVVIWQRNGYRGELAMGEVGLYGRLRYIDGCSDTILTGPVMKGLPCLNALFMPPGIHQTMHTHPSLRSGMILNGNGAVCETPVVRYDLTDGAIFIMDAETEHKFRTDHIVPINGRYDQLRLVAYHPDSDFGPTDEDHPMLNRTIVDGVSASLLPNIQTRP